MKIENKKGFEFGFGWIFAIFVGGVIIFLAVYGVTNIVKTERQGQDVASAKEFGILLTPVETSLQSGKLSPPIIFPARTRVYNLCRSEGNFGVQRIRVAGERGIGEKFQESNMSTPFYNKYLFSPTVMEGKKFYAFTKPFEMPFKIADLIYILGEEKYCFVSPPGEIEDELNSVLTNGNLGNVTGSVNDCESTSIKVCFGYSQPKCNILVSFDSDNPEVGIVTNNKQDVAYKGYALMYAAIFSDPGIYECQVERLMKRASSLAIIYSQKAAIVSAKSGGCGSIMEEGFAEYAQTSVLVNQSKEIDSMSLIVKNIEEENDGLSCKMF